MRETPSGTRQTYILVEGESIHAAVDSWKRIRRFKIHQVGGALRKLGLETCRVLKKVIPQFRFVKRIHRIQRIDSNDQRLVPIGFSPKLELSVLSLGSASVANTTMPPSSSSESDLEIQTLV